MPDEDNCTICGHWPPSLRPIMRLAITKLPPKKPVCDECLQAFRQHVCGKLRKPRGKRRIWPFGG